jgi:hypothetical protein
MTTLSAGYDRKFGDGHFGSEGMSLSWTVTYDDDSDLACDSEVLEARCAEIVAKLRVAVLTELSKSRADQVAWAAKQELNAPQAGNQQPEHLEDLPF